MGQCISFSDLSINATSWSWTFAGGNPSSFSSQNPSNICYSAAGTYSVTLTATNSAGTDSKTGYITVVVCNAPTADFFSNDSSLCEGQCINFYDASTNATNYIL